ncbi:MAG: hypothetical protein ACKO5E_16070, partial [bacterium]
KEFVDAVSQNVQYVLAEVANAAPWRGYVADFETPGSHQAEVFLEALALISSGLWQCRFIDC